MTERAPEANVDYAKASADLKLYLPLKLATFAWFLIAFSAGGYGVAATWGEWLPYTELNIENLDTAKPAIYSFLSGFLGASVFAFRGFYWAVGPQSETNRRYQYDPNWTMWYISRPIMGAFLGVFTFALLRAGVATLGTPSSDTGASAAHFAVAFLAGFAATEVLNWFAMTARTIFSSVERQAGSDKQRHEDGGRDVPQ